MTKDYQILKEALIKVLDGNPLDIGGKYFVLKEVFATVETLYYTQINKEIMEENNKGVTENAESVSE